jgi:hypothetical protein
MTYRFQICPRCGGTYAVIDRQTGQCHYVGTLDGARAVQARLMAGARR